MSHVWTKFRKFNVYGIQIKPKNVFGQKEFVTKNIVRLQSDTKIKFGLRKIAIILLKIKYVIEMVKVVVQNLNIVLTLNLKQIVYQENNVLGYQISVLIVNVTLVYFNFHLNNVNL